MSAYTVRFTRQALILSLEQLELEFSLEDGGMRALRRPGEADLTGHGVARPSVDVSLADTGWLTERSFARYLNHTLAETADGVELVMIIGLGPLKIYDRYRVAGSLITRRISIENAGIDEVALCGVRLALPGACVGRPERCRFEAPAHVVRPRLPIATLRTDQRRGHWSDVATLELPAFGLAPGDAPGLLALHNDVVGETLACWYEDASNPARLRVEGDGAAVTLLHELRIAERLRAEVALSIGVQSIWLHNAPWAATLPRLRAMMFRNQAEVECQSPAGWIGDTALYVVHPSHYGGYQHMIDALDEIRRLGCETICLLPLHDIATPESYIEDWPDSQPEDLYALRSFAMLDPQLGDGAALAELVSAAHARQMRVILDLPLSGCAADSAYVVDHPDWFCRDQGGQIIHFPGAVDTFIFDWRAADLRARTVSEIVALLEQTGLDGFRVLVARDLPPGWPLDAAHGGGNLSIARLLTELRAAMRQANPAAALVTDLAGPLLFHSRDLIVDQAAHHMFTQLAIAALDASAMQTWLADALALTGLDAPRACYSESHHSNISNPLAEALRGSRVARMCLEAMVCCGFVPMIRAGQEIDNREHLARLLHARARSATLRRGSVELGGVRCDDPAALLVLRRQEGSYVVGVINTGPSRRRVTVELPIADLDDGLYIVDDLLQIGPGADEAGIVWRRADLAAFSVMLAPFGACLLAPRRVET